MELGLETQYRITDREFDLLRNLIKELTGINLTDQKKMLVISRLSKRLRELGLSSFTSYHSYIVSSDSGKEELDNLINRMTTNKTDFYRERHHFEYLRNVILPQIYEEGVKSRGLKLRIWSAGCSSGEEPYTIAMTLREFFKDKPGWDIKILATDLDTEILNKARMGLYAEQIVDPIPSEYLYRYFKKGVGPNSGLFLAKNSLKNMIVFRRHNLINDRLSLKKSFDIIFCRNVIIYFDSVVKAGVIDRFHKALKSDGHLFLGHSESLLGSEARFKLVGNSMFCKTD